MNPTDGKPPWLALYEAETARLKALCDFYVSDVLLPESAMAHELERIILDVAGRSSVAEFVPAWINKESVA